MTLRELLEDPIVRLPKEQKSADSKSFRVFLFEILDEFLGKIRGLKLDKEITSALPNAEKKRAENLIGGIKNAVTCYLDGQPYQAYEQLNKVFTGSRILEDIPLQTYDGGSHFYRLRHN